MTSYLPGHGGHVKEVAIVAFHGGLGESGSKSVTAVHELLCSALSLWLSYVCTIWNNKHCH